MNCPICNSILLDSYTPLSSYRDFACNCNSFTMSFFNNVSMQSYFKTDKYELNIFYGQNSRSFIDRVVEPRQCFIFNSIIIIDTSLDINSQLENYILLS